MLVRSHFSNRAVSKRVIPIAVALCAIAFVAVAPLALDRNNGASAAVIGGASSINDRVSVALGDVVGPTTDFHVLGFNDFHGNLEAPSGSNGRIYNKYAGGAAYLTKLVKDKETLYGSRVATVMAGDLIGATPLASALFFDEPSILVANHMGVDFASVGNHEFDKGKNELLRMQNGGCKVPEGCTAAPYTLPGGGTTATFPGADFQYMSANVVDDATTNTLFPATQIKSFPNGSGGTTKVGFIGLVLEDTPTIVTPSGVAGLTFGDETVAANNAAAALKTAGAETIVMVIHQGGFQTPAPSAANTCQGNLAGSPIETIVNNGLDPDIGVIISGHTHAEYRCTLSLSGATRLITSASSFGRILSDITLTIDDTTGKITAATATNEIVLNSTNADTSTARVADPTKEDPTVASIVSQYVSAAAPLANTVTGKITADIRQTGNGFGESALGDVIADAQLASTSPVDKGGAKVAFMNPGGIRADLVFNQISGSEQIGEVTYGEAFTVQPFANTLVVKTMTGAQIRSLLEQQFIGCGGQTTKRILQISNEFRYEQSEGAPSCSGKIGQIWIDDVLVQPGDSVRVTMNSFLATGGDGFALFNQGTDQLGGDIDLDALAAYVTANPNGVAPGPQNRIQALVPDPVVPEVKSPMLLTLSGALLVIAAVGGLTIRRQRTRRVHL